MPKVVKTTNFRVLVVEDNPLIRESIQVAADRLSSEFEDRHWCFEVMQAADGATAVDCLDSFEFDLVIVDLYVPILSGLDIIQKMRSGQRTKSTPILAMSASIEDARARSLTAGADRFLQKPLKLVDVLQAMKSLLKLAERTG